MLLEKKTSLPTLPKLEFTRCDYVKFASLNCSAAPISWRNFSKFLVCSMIFLGDICQLCDEFASTFELCLAHLCYQLRMLFLWLFCNQKLTNYCQFFSFGYWIVCTTFAFNLIFHVYVVLSLQYRRNNYKVSASR